MSGGIHKTDVIIVRQPSFYLLQQNEGTFAPENTAMGMSELKAFVALGRGADPYQISGKTVIYHGDFYKTVTFLCAKFELSAINLRNNKDSAKISKELGVCLKYGGYKIEEQKKTAYSRADHHVCVCPFSVRLRSKTGRRSSDGD